MNCAARAPNPQFSQLYSAAVLSVWQLFRTQRTWRYPYYTPSGCIVLHCDVVPKAVGNFMPQGSEFTRGDATGGKSIYDLQVR